MTTDTVLIGTPGFALIHQESTMSSKNKGGREVRKPKQIKKAAAAPEPSAAAKAVAARKTK